MKVKCSCAGKGLISDLEGQPVAGEGRACALKMNRPGLDPHCPTD